MEYGSNVDYAEVSSVYGTKGAQQKRNSNMCPSAIAFPSPFTYTNSMY